MYQPNKELTETETQHPCLPKWRARVDEAEKRGNFTQRDRRESFAWDTCAVGEARTRYGVEYEDIALQHNPGPLDFNLNYLGGQFHAFVKNNEFACARRTIERIEKRLAELR